MHVRKREYGSIDAFLEKGVRISPKKGHICFVIYKKKLNSVFFFFFFLSERTLLIIIRG